MLIRAVEPLDGIDIMLKRTGKPILDFTLTKGPGNVGKALGIFKRHSGLHLLDDESDNDRIYLVDDGFKLKETDIGSAGELA